MSYDEDLADDVMSVYSTLKQHRTSFWDPAWQAIARLLFPREPNILMGTGSKKWRPNNKMFDRTGAEALDIATNGIVSQWISPVRQWMKMTVEDQQLADKQAVRVWLEQTTADMLAIFARTNVYGAMGRFVRDSLWASSVVYIEEDADKVIRLYPEEVGTFCIGKDDKGDANIIIREFALTARNIRKKFPDAVLPKDVMNAMGPGQNGLAEFTVIHYVGVNPCLDKTALDYNSKPFLSIYLVCDTIISMGGYDMFPYLVGEWTPEGEDVYSVTPALAAYGDMRSLQIYAKGKLKAGEKMVDPALAVPAGVSDVKRDPGSEVTVTGGDRVHNLEEIRYDWNGVQIVTSELKESVQRAFYVPLFQHFLNSTRREQTAEEVRAKLDEQYASFGPIIANMNTKVAAYLIDYTFAIMVKQKRLRPIPVELRGVPLKIVYLSEFERAQQTSALRQLQGFALDLVNWLPLIQNPPDQIDVDELIQKSAELRQIPETIVRDDFDIRKRQQAKAKLVEQHMQQQQEAQQAQNTLALGKARVTPETALGQMT